MKALKKTEYLGPVNLTCVYSRAATQCLLMVDDSADQTAKETDRAGLYAAIKPASFARLLSRQSLSPSKADDQDQFAACHRTILDLSKANGHEDEETPAMCHVVMITYNIINAAWGLHLP